MPERNQRLGSKMQKLLELLDAGWIITEQLIERRTQYPNGATIVHTQKLICTDPSAPHMEPISIERDTIKRCVKAGLITHDTVFGYILTGKPWQHGFYGVETL